MPEEVKKTRAHLTDEDWEKFSFVYLNYFAHMPRVQAYAAAVRDMRKEGLPYPSYHTLLRRLKGDAEDAPAESCGAGRCAATPAAPAVAVKRQPGKDNAALALDLLRCYRFRREDDLDVLTDRLFPHLGDSGSKGA